MQSMDYKIGERVRRMMNIQDIDEAIKLVIKWAEEEGLEWKILSIW